MNSRRVVALVWIALAAACGARTGLLAPEIEDAATDANKSDAHADVHDATSEDATEVEEDATEEDVVFPDVPIVSDCPDAGDTLVYVLGSKRELYSFYPPTLAFKSIGTIACPTSANPNSMAVTRSGIAFTNFLSGELFEISTANAACKATPYDAGQQGWSTYGMGYAGIPDGGETLYVSGFSKQGLAMIDTSSFTLDPIAQYQPVEQFSCELTGTGDGHLYAFCPFGTGAWFHEIDPVTAQLISSHQLSTGGSLVSWAFAFWGGDFWLFTNSNVTKYDPVTQTETLMTQAPIEIVGAGVSTCAPL
jgi:hypothetical protein